MAEAGCPLTAVQAAAETAGRLFPLSLGSEGTCQIGGNLSTNAGGVSVIRYGMARDLVLGLEVVLADGRIWNGLRTLRKDNTGYDLKQLFLGAEGSLGVITAASLRLYARPREFTIMYFDFLLVVYGYRYRKVCRRDTCMRPEAWKMLLGNAPFVLGVPVALGQLWRVYTGKGFAGLLGNAAAGRWPEGSDVVFVHTGGGPSVFAEAGAPAI